MPESGRAGLSRRPGFEFADRLAQVLEQQVGEVV
jgi:hypothetical protein